MAGTNMFQRPTIKLKVYVGLAVTVLVLVILKCMTVDDLQVITLPLAIPRYKIKQSVSLSGNNSRNIIKWIPEYLQTTKIENIETVANPEYSFVEIRNKKTHYKIGDRIEIYIKLRDSRNKVITKGGDILRIWMTEETLNANTGGYIIDYHDGSFLGIIEALWAGTPKIKIAIGCTKEHIGIYLNYLEKYGTYFFVIGIFEKEGQKGTAETQCASIPNSHLFKGKICNFTADNYNMSFYCEQPVGYQCKDWNRFRYQAEAPSLDRSTSIFCRTHVYLQLPSFKIKVQGDLTSRQRVSSPAKSCSGFPAAETWNSRVPAGYMYGDKWTSLQCSIDFPRTKEAYTKCLTNTPLIFIGDSTTRIFFVSLMKFLNLTFDTPEVKVLNDKSWQRHVLATSPDHVISMEWMPHEHPFASTGFRRNLRSVSARVNQIGSNRDVIILIHWYLHPARYLNHHLYREHVRNAVVAIKSLLKRSPNAKILIKGPHSHTYPNTLVPYDYVRLYMEQIIYEEFKDIQKSVYYVNYWDMTLGNQNVNAHPIDSVNDIMIHNLLSFVCRN